MKSNLSKRGKFYLTNPVKHIKSIEDHTQLVEGHWSWSWGKRYKPTTTKVTAADFIIEYI